MWGFRVFMLVKYRLLPQLQSCWFHGSVGAREFAFLTAHCCCWSWDHTVKIIYMKAEMPGTWVPRKPKGEPQHKNGVCWVSRTHISKATFKRTEDSKRLVKKKKKKQVYYMESWQDWLEINPPPNKFTFLGSKWRPSCEMHWRWNFRSYRNYNHSSCF